MANLAIGALEEVRRVLLEANGLNQRLYEIAVRDSVELPRIEEDRIVMRHVAIDVDDRNSTTAYPAIYLYCESMENRLERKFSEFSGRLALVIDIRASGENVAELDGGVIRIAEAVADTLADRRGRWNEHLAYDGKHEAKFEPVRRGGLHFVQTARVELDLLANA